MSTAVPKFVQSNTYYGVVTLVSLLALVLDGRLGAVIFVLFAGIPAIAQVLGTLTRAAR